MPGHLKYRGNDKSEVWQESIFPPYQVHVGRNAGVLNSHRLDPRQCATCQTPGNERNASADRNERNSDVENAILDILCNQLQCRVAKINMYPGMPLRYGAQIFARNPKSVSREYPR